MVWRLACRPRTEARTRRQDDHSRGLTPDGPLRKTPCPCRGLGWLVSDHVVGRGLHRIGRCRTSDMGDEPWERIGRCASGWIRTRRRWRWRWPSPDALRFYGEIANQPDTVRRLIERLADK